MKYSKPLASRPLLGVLLILAPLIFAFAIGLDLYVPSIPTIRAYFGVNESTMQLTVSLYLLITGLVQFHLFLRWRVRLPLYLAVSSLFLVLLLRKWH